MIGMLSDKRVQTKRIPARALAAALALVWALATPAAAENKLPGLPPIGEGGGGRVGFFEQVVRQFSDPALYLDMTLVLLLAAGFAAVIAYHPMTRRKASTIEEVEQPKTFIMYALVGALVGHAVTIDEMMAFVVFGIGGLLRFRTDVGQAKDTGRVILVTIIGICCGLGSFLIAILATGLGWVLIWLLESQQAGRLQVKNLPSDVIPAAAEAYREVLEEEGCRILRERKNFVKGQVTFVFQAPRDLEREELETRFEELPESVRGVIDWDIA